MLLSGRKQCKRKSAKRIEPPEHPARAALSVNARLTSFSAQVGSLERSIGTEYRVHVERCFLGKRWSRDERFRHCAVFYWACLSPLRSIFPVSEFAVVKSAQFWVQPFSGMHKDFWLELGNANERFKKQPHLCGPQRSRNEGATTVTKAREDRCIRGVRKEETKASERSVLR